MKNRRIKIISIVLSLAVLWQQGIYAAGDDLLRPLSFAIRQQPKAKFIPLKGGEDLRSELRFDVSSISSHSRAAYKDMEEHLADAERKQIWGEPIEDMTQDEPLRNMLTASVRALPEGTNIVLIANNSAAEGSLERKFLLFDKSEGKWIFAHVEIAADGKKTIYLAEEAFRELIVSKDAACVDFLNNLFSAKETPRLIDFVHARIIEAFLMKNIETTFAKIPGIRVEKGLKDMRQVLRGLSGSFNIVPLSDDMKTAMAKVIGFLDEYGIFLSVLTREEFALMVTCYMSYLYQADDYGLAEDYGTYVLNTLPYRLGIDLDDKIEYIALYMFGQACIKTYHFNKAREVLGTAFRGIDIAAIQDADVREAYECYLMTLARVSSLLPYTSRADILKDIEILEKVLKFATGSSLQEEILYALSYAYYMVGDFANARGTIAKWKQRKADRRSYNFEDVTPIIELAEIYRMKEEILRLEAQGKGGEADKVKSALAIKMKSALDLTNNLLKANNIHQYRYYKIDILLAMGDYDSASKVLDSMPYKTHPSEYRRIKLLILNANRQKALEAASEMLERCYDDTIDAMVYAHTHAVETDKKLVRDAVLDLLNSKEALPQPDISIGAIKFLLFSRDEQALGAVISFVDKMFDMAASSKEALAWLETLFKKICHEHSGHICDFAKHYLDRSTKDARFSAIGGIINFTGTLERYMQYKRDPEIPLDLEDIKSLLDLANKLTLAEDRYIKVGIYSSILQQFRRIYPKLAQYRDFNVKEFVEMLEPYLPDMFASRASIPHEFVMGLAMYYMENRAHKKIAALSSAILATCDPISLKYLLPLMELITAMAAVRNHFPEGIAKREEVFNEVVSKYPEALLSRDMDIPSILADYYQLKGSPDSVFITAKWARGDAHGYFAELERDNYSLMCIEQMPLVLAAHSVSREVRSGIGRRWLGEAQSALRHDSLEFLKGPVNIFNIYAAMAEGRIEDAMSIFDNETFSCYLGPADQPWKILVLFSNLYSMARSGGGGSAVKLEKIRQHIEEEFADTQRLLTDRFRIVSAGTIEVLYSYFLIAKGNTDSARDRLLISGAQALREAKTDLLPLINYLLAVCYEKEGNSAKCLEYLEAFFTSELWIIESSVAAKVHGLNMLNKQRIDEAIAHLISRPDVMPQIRANAAMFLGVYGDRKTAAAALKAQIEEFIGNNPFNEENAKHLSVFVEAMLNTSSHLCLDALGTVRRWDSAAEQFMAREIPFYEQRLRMLSLRYDGLRQDADISKISRSLGELRASLRSQRYEIISPKQARLLIDIELVEEEVNQLMEMLLRARQCYSGGMFQEAAGLFNVLKGQIALTEKDLQCAGNATMLADVRKEMDALDFSNLAAMEPALSNLLKRISALKQDKAAGRLKEEITSAREICRLCLNAELTAAEKSMKTLSEAFPDSIAVKRLDEEIKTIAARGEEILEVMRKTSAGLKVWLKHTGGMESGKKEEFLAQLYTILESTDAVSEIDKANEEILECLNQAIEISLKVQEYPMAAVLAERFLDIRFNQEIKEKQVLALVKLNYDIVNSQFSAEEFRDERLERETRTLHWPYSQLLKKDTGFVLKQFKYMPRKKKLSDIFTTGDSYIIDQLERFGMRPKFRVVEVDDEKGEVFFELSEIRDKERILAILPPTGTICRIKNHPLMLQKGLLSDMSNALESSRQHREQSAQHLRGKSSGKGKAKRDLGAVKGLPQVSVGFGRPIDILLGISKDVTQEDQKRRKPGKLAQKDFFDQRIFHDAAQRQAVESGIDMSTLVTMIQGPPGTGKTTVIREIVRQLVKQGKRVLVVSQSNAAVDNVGKGFFKKGVGPEGNEKIEKFIPFVRVGNDPDIIGAELLWNWGSKGDALDELEQLRASGKGYVVLGTNMGFSADEDIKRHGNIFQDYDVVIMDESSRATIGETLFPLSRARQKIILVGDHKQLPPYGIDEKRQEMIYKQVLEGLRLERNYEYIFSDEAMDLFKTSLFEMAYESSPGVDRHFLNIAYRFHPAIAGLVSIDYGGEIGYNPARKNEPLTPYTIDITDTLGRCHEEDIGEGRYRNAGEINYLLRKIDILLNLKTEKGEYALRPQDITIIAPYRLQISEIKSALRLKALNNEKVMGTRALAPDELATLRNAYRRYDLRMCGQRSITPEDIEKIKLDVATVDSFMGSENAAIEVLHVRSNRRGDIGFVANHNRGTVMYSRAQNMVGLTLDVDTFTNAHFRIPDDITDRRRLAQLQRRKKEVDEARERFIRKLAYRRLIYSGMSVDEALNKVLRDPISDLLKLIYQRPDSRGVPNKAPNPAKTPKEIMSQI